MRSLIEDVFHSKRPSFDHVNHEIDENRVNKHRKFSNPSFNNIFHYLYLRTELQLFIE